LSTTVAANRQDSTDATQNHPFQTACSARK